MSLSAAGLVAFVVMVLVADMALGADLYLLRTGRVTITQWATRRPWRAAVIVAAAALGIVGLAVHFATFRN